MSSNNAIIVLKGQTTGPIVKGEALDYVKRPYEFNDLQDGDIVVQAMYLSADPYLVESILDKANYREVRFGMSPSSRIPLYVHL